MIDRRHNPPRRARFHEIIRVVNRPPGAADAEKTEAPLPDTRSEKQRLYDAELTAIKEKLLEAIKAFVGLPDDPSHNRKKRPRRYARKALRICLYSIATAALNVRGAPQNFAQHARPARPNSQKLFAPAGAETPPPRTRRRKALLSPCQKAGREYIRQIEREYAEQQARWKAIDEDEQRGRGSPLTPEEKSAREIMRGGEAPDRELIALIERRERPFVSHTPATFIGQFVLNEIQKVNIAAARLIEEMKSSASAYFFGEIKAFPEASGRAAKGYETTLAEIEEIKKLTEAEKIPEGLGAEGLVVAITAAALDIVGCPANPEAISKMLRAMDPDREVIHHKSAP